MGADPALLDYWHWVTATSGNVTISVAKFIIRTFNYGGKCLILLKLLTLERLSIWGGSIIETYKNE
jgi:hypothetical protein